MLFVTLFMYLLSTAYWAYTIVYVINLLHQHLDIQFQSLADHDEISKWYPLLNSVVMINVWLILYSLNLSASDIGYVSLYLAIAWLLGELGLSATAD
jgi:hypothetical protein